MEMREDQLRVILPKNYEYYIQGVSVKECGNVPSEVKLEAHFRVNVSDTESFQVFLSDFHLRSGSGASLYGMKNAFILL